MTPELKARLASVFGNAIRAAVPVPGGDINSAFRVTLADQRQLFVKSHAGPPPGFYSAEAEGLRWLAEANVLTVPKVLSVADDEPAYLALRFIDSAARCADFDVRLGRGLAALHQSLGRSESAFGLDRANYIGVLPQDNTPMPDWPSFYAQRRLLPQLQLAVQSGLVDHRMRREFDRLLSSIEQLAGPTEPPARLHGDLWRGNLMVDQAGLPCLIDPAVYAGHREMDLAMMQLFGGFSAAVFDAYDQVWPRTAGHQRRVALYQLYPLLVHVNLFGAGYLAAVERALTQALSRD